MRLPFTAELWRIGRDKPDLKTQADVQRIVDDLAPGGDLKAALWWVESSETLRKNRRPDPPFTTSTMQQAAARSLRFPPGLTMKLAQQLYEGVPLGEAGTVGLITYMRTDSTAVAPEAQAAAREVIERFWGADYLPARPPVYHTKVKSAQEAHEAIRPTDPQRTPKVVRLLPRRQAGGAVRADLAAVHRQPDGRRPVRRDHRPDPHRPRRVGPTACPTCSAPSAGCWSLTAS